MLVEQGAGLPVRERSQAGVQALWGVVVLVQVDGGTEVVQELVDDGLGLAGPVTPAVAPPAEQGPHGLVLQRGTARSRYHLAVPALCVWEGDAAFGGGVRAPRAAQSPRS